MKKSGSKATPTIKGKVVNDETTESNGVGWHLTMNRCPHKGKSCAVDPIRDVKHVRRIQKMLQERPRDYALFVLGTRTNLRGSDLLSLRFRDVVDKHDKTIMDKLSLAESKTGKIKYIALQPIAKKALQGLLPTNGEPVDMNAYLFPSRKINKDGEYKLSVVALHGLVRKWTKRAGIKGHYGSHTLRKTFALRALNLGYPIQTVMLLLNHTSIASTLHYCGITRKEIEDATLTVTF